MARPSIQFLTSNLVILAFIIIVASPVYEAQSRQAQPEPQNNPAQPSPYPPPVVSAEQFDRWMRELSNWGRWGKDDQVGAANLITAAKRRQALALAKEGIAVSLAHRPLLEKAADNRSPFERETNLTSSRVGPGLRGSNNRYSVVYHGRAHSHIDGLCHRFYKERMYNGFSYREVTREGGCAKNGIQNLQNGIITRGVLIDIPRLKGVSYLDPLTPVFPEDIEAWEKKAGIKVSAGDAILLYTGRWARRAKLGPFTDFAGYHALVAPWLKTRDVALIGSDGVQDIGDLPGVGSPIHNFALVALGATLLDNLDLEALAQTAAKLNRWEFLLTVAPIPVEAGTGSPVNPIAIF